MNEQKLRGLIGLAVKARQAETGMEACRILIRSGKCGILLIDGAAGPNTRKKAADLCAGAHTPLRRLPEGTVPEATGKNNIVIGLKKGSIAEEILRIMPEETDSRSISPDPE